MSDFGKRLIELRTSRGLNQKDAATSLGVSNSRYNKWETGTNQPDYETLCRIANHYKVSTDYLIAGVPEPSRPQHQPTQADIKHSAQSAVLRLIARVSDGITTNDAITNGMDAGELFKGCAAVLKALDDITVSNE